MKMLKKLGLAVLAAAILSGSIYCQSNHKENATKITIRLKDLNGGTVLTQDVVEKLCNKNTVKSVVIEDGVTEIDVWAFRDLKSLNSVTIPTGVTKIGSGAFRGCSSLTSVTVEATTPTTVVAFLDLQNMFYDCPDSLKIYVPSGSVNWYKNAFAWEWFADKIEAIK